MATLLVIIYIAFISLGLPDALIGASWPAISVDLMVPLSYAGIVSMITSGGTILSSLMSNRLITRFKTGPVMVVSVAMTAVVLLCYSFVNHFAVLCLLAIPMGLGAGSVDAALNNFVAQHYKASHMSWLHCFWGIGATLGPMIMSYFLGQPGGWHQGSGTIAVMQFALVAVLMCSLPLWKKVEAPSSIKGEETAEYVTNAQALRVPGVKLALITFFCFVGFESTAGIWMSSFMVEQKGMAAAEAARWASLFFLGTTIGRMVSGAIAVKIKSKQMIRIGLLIALIAAIVILLPLPVPCTLFGFLLLGLGNAPLYPSMIHETPRRFGQGVSQAAMGLQMACAYIGSTFLPPVEGLFSRWFSLGLVPWAILLLVCSAVFFNEWLNRVVE